MPASNNASSRRAFLQTSAALAAASQLPNFAPAKEPAKRPKVAVIFTSFFFRSHAHVLLENFLVPYLFNGEVTDPGVDVVSFYAEQTPKDDMAPAIAKQFGVPMFPSIEKALCVGGESLAVDAVLAIGEHGDYPLDALGRQEYPRKRFFDESVKVMQAAKRFVPYFNDKHLSYRGDWSHEMVQTAHKLGIPLMAGSSVPLAQRIPAVEMPAGAEIEEAVSIHGGPIERYDFHAFEVLQSMVENRKGGESGVAALEFLPKESLWKDGKPSGWNEQLVNAAMQQEQGAEFPGFTEKGEKFRIEHAIRVTYRDGLKATVLAVAGPGMHWNFAAKLKGEATPIATRFHVGPWSNRNLFKALSHAIQHFFRTGKAPYPVERTLLTSVMTDETMQSKASGKPSENERLLVSYKPLDFSAMREMGKTWQIITEDTPQPKGIQPLLKK